MWNLCFFLLLLLTIDQGQSQCRRPPLWLFSLPEDIEPIFSGLTSPFVLVDNGTVLSLIAEPNPVVANIFSLDEKVAEFPVVACIWSEELNAVNFAATVTSFAPGILTSSLSIPSTGQITPRPFRFRQVFNCLASSDDQAVIVGVTFNISIPTEVFCETSLYVAKKCGPPGTPIVPLGVTDGFLNLNFSFKAPPTEMLPVVTRVIPPTTSAQITVTLPAVLVPLLLLSLLVVLVIFILWGVWYRKKNRDMEVAFHPESVSLAYQGVYTQWIKRGPHEKEFPREKVHLVRELGEGAFGVVYQAAAEGIGNAESAEFQSTDVAVKQLREGSNDVDDFFREVDFMSKLDHPNIVKLTGVCSLEEPFCMIFEYMDLGDLCNFLRQAIGLGRSQDNLQEDCEEEPLLTQQELLTIAAQIADGMTYISNLGLVHRDLATRNCLVATGLVVKIGDFGMSRSVNDSDYYRVKGKALLPVRWMSPESILYGKFTVETDVWAYGVLLWEIFTFGQQPYSGLSNEEVIQMAQKGGHPDPPDNCPTLKLMLQCWDKNPKKRPSYITITNALQELIDNN